MTDVEMEQVRHAPYNFPEGHFDGCRLARCLEAK